jgi:hypothetical protein
MNDFTGWKIDTLRGKVITLRGEELNINKYEDGWVHVNYKTGKIGLSKIKKFIDNQLKKEQRPYDIVLDYMLSPISDEYPCPAVGYWLVNYRIPPFKPITPALFKKEYKNHFKFFKPS